MANLEVQIGADSSEFNSEISKVEKQLKTLERRQEIRVKAGLDTGDLNKRINEAKTNLDKLKTAMSQAGQSANNFQKPVVNAGNTLTNFGRIAQDFPFGIQGIGNNLTATAEAFSSLSKQAGGAQNALKAVASSLMGGGGILLAVSLVTSALTIMSQKGLTVGDVFNKLTGNFDEFKNSLKEINKEAVESGAEQAASVGAYVAAAKNINLSMKDRLTAVQKLQDEYPGYFGNLTKEQILNGQVGNAVQEVTKALIAKAKAQGIAQKIAQLSVEELPLREKEATLIKEVNDGLRERDNLYDKVLKNPANTTFANQLVNAQNKVNALKNQLADVQNPLRENLKEQRRWTDEINKTTAASIKLEEKTPKVIKPKKIKIERPDIELIDNMLKPSGIGDLFKANKANMFASLTKSVEASRVAFISNLEETTVSMRAALMEFNKGLRDELVLAFNEDLKKTLESGISSTFGGIGEAIGEALASGGNVVEAVGASLVASMGSVLSAIGDKLIALGAASLLASTVFSTFGTALGVGAALAAIAGGVALKIGGSFLGGMSKGMTSGGGSGSTSNISAGNSVTSPTSSVSSGSSFNGGFQNVVFEISGQSLVGVLSNTLNKNVKLGGTPAI